MNRYLEIIEFNLTENEELFRKYLLKDVNPYIVIKDKKFTKKNVKTLF